MVGRGRSRRRGSAPASRAASTGQATRGRPHSGVHHLGQRGAHARPLAGGHDEDGWGGRHGGIVRTSVAAMLELLDWKRTRARHLRGHPGRRGPRRRLGELARRARPALPRAPQSPIPEAERAAFGGLDLYGYDPELRVLGEVEAAEPRRYEIGTSGDGTYTFSRFAVTRFELAGEALELELYWLEGYGGGLFVPFADATSGERPTAPGYLFDTVKGADLGTDGGRRSWTSTSPTTLVLLRPALGLPAGAAGEPPDRPDPRGRAPRELGSGPGPSLTPSRSRLHV